LPAAIGDTSEGILKHLSLLFVPAGVGVVQQLKLLGDEGGRLILIIVLSTVIALTVTAVTFAALARALGDSDGSRSGLSAPTGKERAP
jgi:holin-like protein